MAKDDKHHEVTLEINLEEYAKLTDEELRTRFDEKLVPQLLKIIRQEKTGRPDWMYANAPEDVPQS